MNAGWIYPHRERCGIARYSLDYIDALRNAVNVIDIDPRWWIDDRERLISAIDNCDILHVQYDTVAFMDKNRDCYTAMMGQVTVPVIVTLHEVHDEDPAVFPRTRLAGPFPLIPLKQIIWDLRHPVQRTFERHLRAHFHAQALIVHHRYHVDILTRKGIPESFLRIIPMPIKKTSPIQHFVFPGLPSVNIAAAGFINPAFDYELLFNVLERIQRPWFFTWIGGLRSSEQQPLLETIKTRIVHSGWDDRFFITGWVDEMDMSSRLAATDIAFAFFRSRSSSASISRVMGAGKPIIATNLPLTEEIAASNTTGEPPLLLTSADPEHIVALIEELIADTGLRRRLFEGLSTYIESVTMERTSRALINLYHKVVTR